MFQRAVEIRQAAFAGTNDAQRFCLNQDDFHFVEKELP